MQPTGLAGPRPGTRESALREAAGVADRGVPDWCQGGPTEHEQCMYLNTHAYTQVFMHAHFSLYNRVATRGLSAHILVTHTHTHTWAGASTRRISLCACWGAARVTATTSCTTWCVGGFGELWRELAGRGRPVEAGLQSGQSPANRALGARNRAVATLTYQCACAVRGVG